MEEGYVCLGWGGGGVFYAVWWAYTHAYSYSMPAPPLANDRCNKTFVKDGAIHHVVQGTKNQAGLKAQTRVPLHRAWIERGRGTGRGGLTKFISYYTLKCDLVMTSVKFNQVLDSVLFKVNQCPS